MQVFLFFVGYFALVAATPANLLSARFDSFKVYRLAIEDELQLNEFRKLVNHFPLHIINELRGIGHNTDILIDPAHQRKFEDVINYLELKFKCLIDDLQSVLEQEEGLPQLCDETISHPHMNWTDYQRLPVIYDWLDTLAAENPHLITSYVAGYSYEKRPIKAIKISSKPGNKAVFIESSIHAIEWISSAATTCFIQNLTHPEDEELKSLLENYDWIFLPVLNPDGLVYTHDVSRLWRKNRKPTGFRNESGICYGTDLNRNFGYEWGVNAYNYDVPCDHFYAGAKSDTEPEVQALESFLDSFPDNYIRMYLAFHSYGNYILLPYGHTSTEFPPNYETMMNIAGAYADAATVPYGTQFKYGASSIVNYPVSGASKDYAYGVKKIPFTATMELRDNGKYGFFLPRSEIVEVCQEVTIGLKAMVKKAQEEGIFH